MSYNIKPRYRVGILGATGLVGQHLVKQLSDHPWFHVVAVAASDRSENRRYGEAARWSLPDAPPRELDSMAVRPCLAGSLDDCDLVFSALSASAARDVEREFAISGIPVVSNSSAHRLAADVPVVVPEINAEHLALVPRQPCHADGGFIVANPNCSAAGLVIALAPLHRAFGLRRVVVTTLQALSGAGTEGPRALELVDNVIPWIAGEEEKLDVETRKMLGKVEGRVLRSADIPISAHCHRVATLDGHLEAVSVELDRRTNPEEAGRVLAGFRGDVTHLELPSSPSPVIEVREEADRPQPRLDRNAGGGMRVVVGRLRHCPALTLRFELLSHNAVRGAAGAAVLNAELLAARGMIRRRASR